MQAPPVKPVPSRFRTRIGRRVRRITRRSPSPSEIALRSAIVAAGGRLDPRPPDPAWRVAGNSTLRTHDEVDAAVRAVTDAGLVPHEDRPKSWDALIALSAILARVPRSAAVLDMGSATYSPVLRWLYAYGYRHLLGIDLTQPRDVRHGPIRLLPMDLTATTFADGSFGAITCLSVIEHGVDVEAYLREASRLLRPGGILITSTDYWPTPVDVGDATAYGHPVHVFERPEIEALLEAATRHGFRVPAHVNLEAQDKVVHWDRIGIDYTFVALVFEKAPQGIVDRLVARVDRARSGGGRRAG